MFITHKDTPLLIGQRAAALEPASTRARCPVVLPVHAANTTLTFIYPNSLMFILTLSAHQIQSPQIIIARCLPEHLPAHFT